MEDIIKMVKSLEDSGLLLKGVIKTVQNQAKKKKKREGFRSILLGTLVTSLLANILTAQEIKKAGKGQGKNRAGEGIVRAGYGFRSSKNKKWDY